MTEQRNETFKLSLVNATFIELAIHVAVIGFLGYWTFTLIAPFTPIILWSVVLTVALYPVFDWLSALLKGRRRWAAALITVLGLVVVIGPVTWLGIGLVEGLRELMEQLSAGKLSIPPPAEAVRSWPLIGQPLYDFWAQASTNLGSALAPLAPQLKPVGEILLGAAGSAGMGTIKFLVSVVITGFLFTPGPSLLAATKFFARKVDALQGEAFVDLAGATIRAVSRGVIGVSLLQAVLAAIGMTAVGAPGASLLTVTILALGIVQVGPWIVVGPLILWGWASLTMGPALGFTICMVTVGLIENIVKPFAMSHGLKTPMPVTFVGVIGGVVTHGIGGLFVGPVVLAVAWEVAKTWISEPEPAAAKDAAIVSPA
jgi:predicted PurR-regulated permease PerM